MRSALAAADPGFNTQAYIGAFFGNYQFWVNVTALVLQAFVASRLVKYFGLRGALLALPLIALGGYAIDRRGRRLRGGALDQDRGERDRLLDHEHGAAAALAADVPRGEVQGQAGHRHLLRAWRRPAVGGGRLRRHERHAVEHRGLRARQRRDRSCCGLVSRWWCSNVIRR